MFYSKEPQYYICFNLSCLLLYQKAPLLFTFHNKAAYQFVPLGSLSDDPNIKQMLMCQPDFCYQFSLQPLSKVTVCDLCMHHVGVAGHSIHLSLCGVTEEPIHDNVLRRGVGGKVAFTTVRRVQGSRSNVEDREAGDRRCAAAPPRSHVRATRVGVH